MSLCLACGHTAPHDIKGYYGCVANVLADNGDHPPSTLQCCCDGTSGPVVRRHGTEPLGEIIEPIKVLR